MFPNKCFSRKVHLHVLNHRKSPVFQRYLMTWNPHVYANLWFYECQFSFTETWKKEYVSMVHFGNHKLNSTNKCQIIQGALFLDWMIWWIWILNPSSKCIQCLWMIFKPTSLDSSAFIWNWFLQIIWSNQIVQSKCKPLGYKENMNNW